MSQKVSTQDKSLSPIEGLLSVIRAIPDAGSLQRWNAVDIASIEPDKYKFALDHALDLYFESLAEDLRTLWPLLGTNQMVAALNTINNATKTLSDIANLVAVPRGPDIFAVVYQLVKARWDFKWAVVKLERAAGR